MSKQSDKTTNGHLLSTITGTASYYSGIAVKNIRCFGEEPQRLSLSQESGKPARWTIVLGNNGIGKTTLLQALALIDIKSRDDFYEKYWDLESGKYLATVALENKRNFIRHDIEEAEIGVGVIEGPSIEASPSEFRHGEYWMIFKQHQTISGNSPKAPRPPICYGYGAGRRLGGSSLVSEEALYPSMSLFHDEVDLINAEEWLLRLDYSASKHAGKFSEHGERLKQVLGLLKNVLPEVYDIRITSPSQAYSDPAVEFKTAYGWVALRHLGHGYRTMISWMVDLASRMVKRYPNSADPLAEPAVVLIDEIDLHLHPKWQRMLISYLTERFPNTQFIATAHSPLIVQAALGMNANIAVLRRIGDHVLIENDKKAIDGWRIDQVLTSDLFGLESARPPSLDEPLKRRLQLLSKPKLTKKDRLELDELEKRIGTLPVGETDVQARKMMALVEETQRLLREREEKKK